MRGVTVQAAVALGAFALVLAIGTPAQAGPTTAKCDASKKKAVAKKVACELGTDAVAELTGGTPDFSKCKSKFSAFVGKLESKRPGGCTTSSDVATLEDKVDAFVSDVIKEITGSAP